MMRLNSVTLEERDLLAADVTVLETFGTNNVVVADDFAFAAAGNVGSNSDLDENATVEFADFLLLAAEIVPSHER